MGDGEDRHCLVQMEWHPARWSVCLPLLIFPCTIKSRSSLLAPAHSGGPRKRAVKRLWCVVISAVANSMCGPSANLAWRSEVSCMRLAGSARPRNSPSGHHRTTLSGYIFATTACIDNWKETCSTAISAINAACFFLPKTHEIH